MSHKEKAVNYFSQKLHCSQSVLAAFADECGITEEEAISIAWIINCSPTSAPKWLSLLLK